MEFKTKVAAALGINADGMDEAALGTAILAACAKQKSDMKASADAKATAEQKLAASLTQVKALEASRDQKPEEPSTQVLKLAGKSRTMELTKLVADGRITAAVRDRLAATWIGTDGAALKASLDDASDRRFDETVAALGEQTRRIAADRAVPGDKTINEAENDKFMAERLAALGVTTK